MESHRPASRRLPVWCWTLLCMALVSVRTSYRNISNGGGIRNLASKTLPSVSLSIQVSKTTVTSVSEAEDSLSSLTPPQEEETEESSSSPQTTTSPPLSTASAVADATSPAADNDDPSATTEEDNDADNNGSNNEHQEDLRPRNLRLAFIGDSVTRYQYLQLVYWLQTGVWAQDDTQSWMFKNTHGDWTDFYASTNAHLQPQEGCDCYQADVKDELQRTPMGPERRHIMLTNTTENRYYSDDRGNYISLLLKYGSLPAHGYWPPDQVYDDHEDANIFSGPVREHTWTYGWGDVIRHHLAMLHPKPDYVVFNAGLHPNDLATDDGSVLADITAALAETGIQGIYKTTTYKDKWRSPAHNSHDKEYCNAFACLDLSWTRAVNGRDHYHDDYHFKANVNQKFNLQLLEYLRH